MDLDSAEIRRLRERRAWSQERLAEIAGLSVRTVQRIERGESASLESRLALASAFDLTPANLGDPQTVPAPRASMTRSREAARTRAGMDARTFRIAMVLIGVVVVFGLFLLFGYLLGRDLALRDARQACMEQGRQDCRV